jgi:uncharacterized protein (UPF0332 family)
MDREFSEILGATLRDRFRSTYDAEAEITQERAASDVADAERFVTAVRSILNY